jgi:hypothetical protein
MESDCKKLLFDHIPSEMAYCVERAGPLKLHLRRITPHLPAVGNPEALARRVSGRGV